MLAYVDIYSQLRLIAAIDAAARRHAIRRCHATPLRYLMMAL